MKNLAGKWYSDLGAELVLSVRPDGKLEGAYISSVGDTSGAFDIVGLADGEEYRGNRCFGAVVLWRNKHGNFHSVTSWSGQYQIIDGEEVLATTWLLTKETEPHQDWLSTCVGSDVFRRVPVKESKPSARAHPHPEMSTT
jgi:hypothetical protein